MNAIAPAVRWARTALAWVEGGASGLDLVIRLYVANVFIKSGLTKIDDWDRTVFLFQEEYHVPLLSPEAAAFLGTSTELFFPVLLAIGLATRLTAAWLSVFNVIAVISFWHVLGQNEAALNQHVFWGFLLLVTLFHGPGKISLDHFVWGRLNDLGHYPRVQ
jgi:putative oxidoreductase